MLSRALNSPKYAKKKRRKAVAFLSVLILLLVVIVFIFVLIMRLPAFQIKDIETNGTTIVSSKMIEEKVLSGLEGQYFGIFPISNVFFYPKNNLEKILKDSFYEIDNVSIKRSNVSKLNISIVERTPTAIVCSGFYDESSDNGSSNEENICYFSDENAYLYSTTSLLSIYNHYYIPDDKKEIMAGIVFMDKTRFNELQDFFDGAVRGGIAPLGILIGEDGEYEMYMKNIIGKNNTSSSPLPDITIYFDDKKPFDFTLSNLLTFWKNSMDKARTSSYPVFDYINLRFGNTIYYLYNE